VSGSHQGRIQRYRKDWSSSLASIEEVVATVTIKLKRGLSSVGVSKL